MPEGKLYNLGIIREISRGNEDFVKKMLVLFIETMPPAIEEMKQHLNSAEWNALGAVAHKIKPSIDTMGIDLLREDIRSIERFGKEALNTDQIPALLEKIERVLDKVADDLRSEMNT